MGEIYVQLLLLLLLLLLIHGSRKQSSFIHCIPADLLNAM